MRSFSLSPAGGVCKITAAATTGPANGPRPASSMPKTCSYYDESVVSRSLFSNVLGRLGQSGDFNSVSFTIVVIFFGFLDFAALGAVAAVALGFFLFGSLSGVAVDLVFPFVVFAVRFLDNVGGVLLFSSRFVASLVLLSAPALNAWSLRLCRGLWSVTSVIIITTLDMQLEEKKQSIIDLVVAILSTLSIGFVAANSRPPNWLSSGKNHKRKFKLPQTKIEYY
jgi:hypothetical protein